MVARKIQIDNVYADDYDPDDDESGVVVTEVTADVRARGPEEADEDWDEYLRDLIWPLTGSGREEGHAGYFAESVDGLDPVISIEWC